LVLIHLNEQELLTSKGRR